MDRAELTDDEWRALAAILPRDGRGRPLKDRRATIDGILWHLRTGAPWRRVPDRFGKWNSVARNFRRWRLNGRWQQIAAALATIRGPDG